MGLKQCFAIERLGEGVRFKNARAQTDFDRPTLLGYFNIEIPGKGTGRFGKGQAIVFHQEGDGIAALLAPKAMKDLPIGIDIERRRLLVMERTKPLPISAGLLEFNVAGDQTNNVGSISDLMDRRFGDPTQIRLSRFVVASRISSSSDESS